jgi:hypothetical protein
MLMMLMMLMLLPMISALQRTEALSAMDDFMWEPPPVQPLPTTQYPFFYPSIQKTFGTMATVSIIIPAAIEKDLDYYVPGYMGADTMFTISSRVRNMIYYGVKDKPVIEGLDHVAVAAGHFSFDDWRVLPHARSVACFISTRHPVVSTVCVCVP